MGIQLRLLLGRFNTQNIQDHDWIWNGDIFHKYRHHWHFSFYLLTQGVVIVYQDSAGSNHSTLTADVISVNSCNYCVFFTTTFVCGYLSEIWAINFVQNSNYSVTDSEQSSTDSKVKQQDSHAWSRDDRKCCLWITTSNKLAIWFNNFHCSQAASNIIHYKLCHDQFFFTFLWWPS